MSIKPTISEDLHKSQVEKNEKNSIRERAKHNTHFVKASVAFSEALLDSKYDYDTGLHIERMIDEDLCKQVIMEAHFTLVIDLLKKICEENPSGTLISTIEQLTQQAGKTR